MNPASTAPAAKHDKRHRHHRRRFMEVFLGMMVGAAVAVEGHKELAEHVERGHAGTAQGKEPDFPVVTGSGEPENLVLGKEPRERREAGNGEHRNKKRRKSDRHPCLEPAHFAHVLLMMHGVDHAAGAEEQAGFEERVGHQMKNRRGIAADADADKHVAELADRGIG